MCPPGLGGGLEKGRAERMTRVRDQEWVRARIRQVRDIVGCWRRRPEVKDSACGAEVVRFSGEKC